MAEILIPAGSAVIKYRVKDSKFIAAIKVVTAAEEAREFIEHRQEKYYDASHNVSAFKIGQGDEALRYSDDDGEPAQSSGPPVLKAIEGSGLTNTVVVVTRYFGGTKLGIGGLIRAYGDSARRVIKAVGVEELKPMLEITVSTNYEVLGVLLGQVEAAGARIRDVIYDNHGGRVLFVISPDKVDKLKDNLVEVTADNVSFEQQKRLYVK